MTKPVVGMNLWGGGSTATWFGTTEQPFLNYFKTGTTWGGWGNVTDTRYSSAEGHMNLDSDGYPIDFTVINPTGGDTTFSRFGQTQIDTRILADQSPLYAATSYVLLYDGGDGTELIHIAGDVSPNVNSNGGRIVFSVGTPTTFGIVISIYAQPATGHLTNFRLTKLSNESALNAGEVVNPDFTSKFDPFAYFRFMDWLLTNSNLATSGGGSTTAAFYNLVPFEFCVAVCNKLNGHLWLNLPCLYSNAGTASLATLIHQGTTDALGHVWAGLNTNLNVYLEFSNEWWNALFQFTLINMSPLGYAAYPDFKSHFGTFTGTVDNGAGGAGNICHVSGVVGANGGLVTANSNTIFDASGTSLGFGLIAGPAPGNGDYTTNGPPLLISTPTTMTQGNDYSAWFQYAINRSIQTTDVFKSVWNTYGDSGRVFGVIGVQAAGAGAGGATYIFQATPTQHGGVSFSANCHIAATTLTIDSGLSGTVRVGQKVVGAGVAAATYIESGSGTTWTVNNSQTVGSAGSPVAMTGQYYYNSTASNLSYCAIAPYFGSDINGQSANTVFNTTIPTDQTTAFTNISGHLSVCQDPSLGNGIGLICYEGGQHYTATGSGISTTVNTDPRMYTAYINYLNGIGPNGATLFTHYSGSQINSGQNNWGCLPSILCIPSATATDGSAKYQALIDFIGTEASGGNVILMGQACL